MEQTVNYTITFTANADNGRMTGSYQLTAGNKSNYQDCEFGHGSQEQAAYLTLITGAGDLINRIQRAGSNPVYHSVFVHGEMPEPPDGRVSKSRDWALGLLRQFGEWQVVEGEAVG
jgi:hypothetical protein